MPIDDALANLTSAKIDFIELEEVEEVRFSTDDVEYYNIEFATNGTVYDVMNQIKADNNIKLTLRDTVGLVNKLGNPSFSNQGFWDVFIDKYNRRGLYTDTAILYVPNEGVYVKDHFEFDDSGIPIMNRDELAEQVKNCDPNVRFAEYDFKIGKMSREDFINN